MKKKAKVDSKASLSIDNPCPIFRKLKKPKVDSFRRSDKVQRQHNICIYMFVTSMVATLLESRYDMFINLNDFLK